MVLFVPWNDIEECVQMESRFLTASQMARIWNISHRRVQYLCASNRIDGAFKIGEIWVIPQDAEKPDDARTKKGKSADV